MFDYIPSAHELVTESKEFMLGEGDSSIDEILGWIGRSHGRVALLRPQKGRGVTAMSEGTFHAIDDAALGYAYLPHWELRGFAVEDMPTVQDILIGADEDLLLDELRIDIESWCDADGVDAVLGEARKLLKDARSMIFTSKIGSRDVILPRETYRGREDPESADRDMQACVISTKDVAAQVLPLPDQRRTKLKYPDDLQLKVWLGGISIRDSYRVMGWVLLELTYASIESQERTLPRKEPSGDDASEYLDELRAAAEEVFFGRIKDLSSRLRDPANLELVTFEMEQDLFDLVQSSCAEKGLSLQNGVQILLQRSIALLERHPHLVEYYKEDRSIVNEDKSKQDKGDAAAGRSVDETSSVDTKVSK